MIRGLIIVLSLLSWITITAQDMVWTRTIGGTAEDAAYNMVVDASGNIYTTGSFGSTVDFDPGPGVFNLTATGMYDIYIQKLDPNGNFVWCQSIGGAFIDEGISIAIDGSGNVYTTGYFEGTVDFDAGVGVFNMTSAISDDDIYIQKLDSNGNFIWAKQIGGSGFVDEPHLAIDGNNNVYTTAAFRGIIDLDPGIITFDFASNWWDIFIQKLDSNGNFVWAKTIGGSESDIPKNIVIDNNNNIHIVGYFAGTTDFDPGSGVFNLTCLGTSVGADNAFILKLDDNGNFVWARDIGGATPHTIHAYGNDIAVDINGNVYTTGDFTSTVDFNPGPGVFSLTAGGSRDMYVQKLDVNGNFVWAKRMGQPGGLWLGATEGVEIAVDLNSNIYITGNFSQTADFDPGLDLLTFTSVTYSDGFIQKLDVNGNLVWVKQIGGASGADGGLDIAVDANNTVYTVGIFRGTVDFDLGSGILNVTSEGNGDAYILKLAQCGSNTVDVVSSCGDYTWIDGNTYTSNTKTGRHVLTNAAGCDSIVSLDLTIQTVNSTIFLLGNTLRTANLGAIYQWIDCSNNTAIQGATNSAFTPTSSGSYALVITDNNCTDTSNCINVVVTGIEDLKNKATKLVRVYPNPVSDYLMVELEKGTTDLQIELIDLNGKVVLSRNYSSRESIKLPIQDLAKGVYFLKIQTKENLEIVKIIKG